MLVIYNNHPYARYPDRRARELALFRAALREEGLRELGFATFPEDGDGEGYTFALVLDASRDRIPWVIDTWNSILMRHSPE